MRSAILPPDEDVARIVVGVVDGELAETGECGDGAGFEQVDAQAGGAAAEGASHSVLSRCRSGCKSRADVRRERVGPEVRFVPNPRAPPRAPTCRTVRVGALLP